MSDLEILAFEPCELRVRGMGPFQLDFERIELTIPEGQPTNLFLLCSANGRGKTTLLEAMVYALSLLDERPLSPAWLDDWPRRDIQLDIWASLRRGGREERLLLSLYDLQSGPGALRVWDPEELERLPATRQLSYGLSRGQMESNELDLFNLLRRDIRRAKERDPDEEAQPLAPTERLPTVLYFPSQRDIPRAERRPEEGLQRPDAWRYRLIHRFDDDPTWSASLDLLLVWLQWLDGDGGRYARAQQIINKIVFEGTPKFLERIDKQALRAVIHTGVGRHRLDQLSSGERNLLQLFSRIAAHMTRNTLIIIDELDLHLHPRLERATVNNLARLVQGRMVLGDESWGPFEDTEDRGERPQHRPLTTVLFTTHSKDCMDEFDELEGSPRLRTASHVIEEDFLKRTTHAQTE